MGKVGIRELRQNASTYVRAARAGDTVTITDRGVPVARLVPFSPAEKYVEQLLGRHALAPPPRSRRRFSDDVRLTGPAITDLLDEDRTERLS